VLLSVIGSVLGFGAFCRFADIPSPATRAIGAIVLIAITLGFEAAGKVVGTR
jgi:XapX domain-containing protein